MIILGKCVSQSTRRVVSLAWRRLAVAVGLIAQLAACNSSGGGDTGTGVSTLPPMAPTVGEHQLVFQRIGENSATIQTAAMDTATAGSALIVSVGRGVIGAFEKPTDNMNSVGFSQIGATHAYTNWPTSGTALYSLVGASGGAGHIVATNTPPNDEVTLAVVEVFGGAIEDAAWNEVLAGQPIKSPSVTTTGPATLVAFWWGDAGVDGEKTAVPSDNFVVIDSILEAGSLVQCAVAVKHVDAAGDYNVTWTSTPVQGAQLYLVAIAD